MNPGNSGGPALVRGKVVGICFQSYKMANNTSYIIPTTVIRHFLLDIHKHNRYEGYVFLGIKYVPLENRNMREMLGLRSLERKKMIKENTGVLVTEVDVNQMGYPKSLPGKILPDNFCRYIAETGERRENTEDGNTGGEEKGNLNDISKVVTSHATGGEECYGVRVNDVLLSIEDKYVNSDGTTVLREDESVEFQYLFNEKFVGDLCLVKVVRNGSIKIVAVRLSKVAYLIPQHNWDKKNSFFVYGGIVFTTLTKSLYTDVEIENPEIYRLIQYNPFKRKKHDEIVILKNILPSKLTIGYNYTDCIVLKVNNITVRNMKHLIGLLQGEGETNAVDGEENSYVKYVHTDTFQPSERLIYFILLTPGGHTVPLVLNKDDVQKSRTEIANTYGIPPDEFMS
ncbi:serine protease DegP, putative (DegP) [Plasmodium ovale wallikeri]|nr:serine protease DegP, putative (DegP) [Plasmodium ovale wallikeri]SBT30929.1 serine protease DegP, putative (DegP) [Plasmodium ovale wallikeri]